MNLFPLGCLLVAVLWTQADCAAIAQPAQIARELIHEADWASFASISTKELSQGYPFANVKSIADVDGVPYMILTDLEFTAKDFSKDNRAGMMVTNAQSGKCQKRNLSAQDPLCERVIITGRVEKVQNSDSNYVRAKEALVAKIPGAGVWLTMNIPGHDFYIAKVNIENIIVMSAQSGSKVVDPTEYFKASI